MLFSRKMPVICLLSVILLYNGTASAAFQQEVTPQKQTRFNPKKGDAAFDKAQELFFNELYGQALLEFRIAEQNSNDPQRISQIGFYNTICNAVMLKGSAISTLTNFLETNDSYIYKNIVKAILAETYTQSGKLEQALQQFREVDSKALSKSMLVRYNFYYGKLFFELGQYPEAEYRLTQAAAKESIYSDDILYYRSYIKYQNKEYDKALEGFVKLASKGKFSKAHIFIAQIKFQKGDFRYIADNLASLQKMTDQSNVSELYRLAGESFYNLGDYSQAIEYMTKYLNTADAKASREQQYILGYSYYMMNMYAKAIEHFTKILDGSDEITQNAYYHLADAYLKENDKKGALRAFSMAAAMNYYPEIEKDALYNYIKLSYEMGSGDTYPQLIDLMRKYIDKYPGTAKTDEIMGYLLSVYINTSDYTNAIAAIKKVKNPSSQMTAALQRMCYEQALLLYQQGAYENAAALFSETMNYNASQKLTALSRYWKAESLMRMGKDKEALPLFGQYLQESTPSVRENQFSHYNIGYIHFNDKAWNNAETSFRKFLSLYTTADKYTSDAYCRLADIAFGRKDYGNAIQLYAKAEQQFPETADYAQYQIAMANGLSGKIENKIAKLKEIIAGNKSVYGDLALVELGATYNRANRFAEGEKALSSFVQARKDSPYYIPALLEMGVANANMGNSAKALDYYKQIVRESPASSEANDALLAIKSIYVSKGEADAYFAFLKDAGRDKEVDNSEKEQISFDALQQLYVKGDTKGLSNSVKQYRAAFPGGAHATDATYYLAESLYRSGDKKGALTELKKLIDMPVTQYTVSALNMAADAYAEIGDGKNRYLCMEKTYSVATDEPTRQRALTAMMEIALQQQDKELIRNSYEKVLADEKAPKEAQNLALFAKAKEAFEKADYITAFAELKKCSLPLTLVQGAEAEYMKAYILFNDKKYNDTETFILNFAKKGTPHQYWLAKAFLLLGDVYVAKKDLFQAKATYQSIVEGYESKNDGIVSLAKQKIEELNNIQ